VDQLLLAILREIA